jgi:hypothetical protein
MDKQVFIDKLALLSEELQVLSTNWIRKDYEISALEVETYLSNLRYLSEQAQILRQLLSEQETPHVHMSSIPNRKTESFDSIELPKVQAPTEPEIKEKNVSFEQAANDEFISELSLHEKLSGQMKESSIADSLKNSFFHKDLSLSLNERFYFINELFNGDQKDFDKVISHLTGLDSWEEVEFYLNATCVLPYAWDEKSEQKEKFYEFLQVRFS